jgi:hypothetical protein
MEERHLQESQLETLPLSGETSETKEPIPPSSN